MPRPSGVQYPVETGTPPEGVKAPEGAEFIDNMHPPGGSVNRRRGSRAGPTPPGRPLPVLGIRMLLLLLACRPAPPDDSAPMDSAADTTDSGTPVDTGTDERRVTDGIWRLDGTDPALPPDDLHPLLEIAATAEIVALGESVHQVDTYHQIRARMIPALVADGGFRVVVLEAPVLPVEATRAWVERDEGSLEDAVRGLYFGVWTSTAFAETLVFLHDWNLAHPEDPVRFFGIDMQGFQYDFPYVRAVLEGVDAAAAPGLLAGVAGCVGGTFTSAEDYTAETWEAGLLAGTETYDEARYTACLAGLDAVDGWAATAPIAATLGDETATLAETALRSVRAMQTELYYPLSDKTAWDVRDLGMADNFETLRAARAGDAPTLLVMHNAHIQRAGERLDPYAFPVGWKNTGSWLDERHGAAYAPVLQLAWKVTWGTEPDTGSSRAGAGTLEAVFHDLGEDLLFVDMDAAAATVPDEALSFGNPTPGTGVPAEHARAVVYARETTAMTPYPF